MKKTIFVFGGISSLILILFIAGFTIFNWGSMMVGYSAMVIAFAFIYVGVRNYRDKFNNGTIGFGKALRIGLGIALLGSSAYVIAWMIDYKFFMPNFAEQYAAIMIKQAHDSGATGAALDAKLAEVQQFRSAYKNPLMVVLYTYAEVLPVGVVISLFTALILKRKISRSPVPAIA